jgi:hypothetical protein
MSMDLPYAAFEIQSYMVIFRQLETRTFNGIEARIRGIVRCTGTAADPSGIEADYRLDVYFLELDSPKPDPIVDLPNRTGSIFLPISEMAFLVDVMRNEKPIYGHLRADNPQWTSITTTQEPVGTGDEDY